MYNSKKKISEKVPESFESVWSFANKSRQEIVTQIETLVTELKPYKS